MLQSLRLHFRALINNEIGRREWVAKQLAALSPGGLLLDAGCGEQQYRQFCGHLNYRGQDFGKFNVDEQQGFAASSTPWNYGELDYVGDIWAIDEKDSTFDAVLCTEVLEHIPRASQTILELSRLLKSGGRLILTVPSNSLRHQDPYYFVAGYSDHFLNYWLTEAGFKNINIVPQGDYHRWLMAECYRTMRSSGIGAKITLLPAFFYHYVKQRRPTQESVATLCLGYHVTAEKA